MPSAFALIALLNALTISLTFALSEPVHWKLQFDELARVLGAVARGHEERVRRHVVDEDEPHLLLARRRCRGAACALRLRGLSSRRRRRRAAAAHAVGREAGRAAGQRRAPGDR